MPHRIVTISNPSWIRKDSEQLSIEQTGQEVARVPIEDIAVLLLDSHGITLTQELLIALVANNASVVFCDQKHLPHSALVPFSANALHARTLREQVTCSGPQKKQIWKQVVQHKIVEQAITLETTRSGDPMVRRTATELRKLSLSVKSGDTGNREAQAAALYFPALFGSQFLREREQTGINAALNYGYALVRAMIARALVGAGLHPALGVFHRGPYNPYNLADDAMEPLRPLVDEAVWRLPLSDLEAKSLNKETRTALLGLTVCTVRIAGKACPIESAMERYAASWREALCGEARKLVVPTRLC